MRLDHKPNKNFSHMNKSWITVFQWKFETGSIYHNKTDLGKQLDLHSRELISIYITWLYINSGEHTLLSYKVTLIYYAVSFKIKFIWLNNFTKLFFNNRCIVLWTLKSIDIILSLNNMLCSKMHSTFWIPSYLYKWQHES